MVNAGLSTKEAQALIAENGYNEIPEKKGNAIRKLLGYFWGPIPWMIEGAALLSAVVGHWEDFWIITTLLGMNVAVAFWQESKADNAIEMLKRRLAPSARVKRDGDWVVMPARNLVPGDLIRLRLGDIIPADTELDGEGYLEMDESALTGESLPVEKEAGDTAYSGAIVRRGEMDGVVKSTGLKTYFGRTANLLQNHRKPSHFQKAIMQIGDNLIVFSLLLISITFAVSFIRGESVAEFLKFALVLLVASIPVALPVVLSVTLAIGAIGLARKEAIVSRLISIEEMAGMDILCSDKTGTITQNRLSIAELIPLGHSEDELLAYALLSSREEDNDPIDDAIISGAGKSARALASRHKALSFQPFDPVVKRTEAEVMLGKKRLTIVKGAPHIVASLAKKDVVGEVDRLAAKGYRALGVAVKDKDWEMVGLIALTDPPRPDSKKTLIAAEKMGIEVKMVTGDHEAIARYMAAKVGIGPKLMKPDGLKGAESADGFYEVYPEHKYRIVDTLQKKGHIVGMTGDGVNDAPALRAADVGIAVAGATDAAKSAADIVLTRPGLSVIVDAIEQSRIVFRRMTNYATYRIAETIRALLFITLSILAFDFYPVTAFMIVLLAILNDAPIMTIAYDRAEPSKRPVRWSMRRLLFMASYLGGIGVCASFLLLYIGLNVLALENGMLQTFIFLKLAVAGHLTMLSVRTKKYFWQSRPAGILLGAMAGTQAIATLIAAFGIFLTPIGLELAGFVWLYAIAGLLVTDFLKVQLYRFMDRHNWFERKTEQP